MSFFACDGEAKVIEPMTVDANDTTEEAVRFDVQEALRGRLESQNATLVASELLLWEVRRLDGRVEASDLVVVWSRFLRDGAPGWVLGQIFRHRDGIDVSWQWYRVADDSWLEFRAYDAPPNNNEVEGFLRYWDFDAEGLNGTLLAATVFERAWIEAIGAAPTVAYPSGTPTP